MQVSDTELTWCDIAVLSEPEKVSDSLPWTLFKDGVREITLTRGFEGDELEKLLGVIPLVRRAQDHEDDILTLLWEQEFVFLSYRFIDNVSGQGAPLDPSATPGRWPAQASVSDPKEAVADAKRRRALIRSTSGSSDEAGRFDRALVAPAENDLAAPAPAAAVPTSYLAREIAREYAADLRHDVVDVLLDIFELNDDDAVREEAAAHLDAMMLHLLTGLNFGNVAHLLREAGVALERAQGVTPAGRAGIERLGDRVSEPAMLGPLLTAVNIPRALRRRGTKFADFVEGAFARAPWVRFSCGAPRRCHPEVRRVLAEAADRMARVQSRRARVKLISAPDPIVAAEAVGRARRRAGPRSRRAGTVQSAGPRRRHAAHRGGGITRRDRDAARTVRARARHRGHQPHRPPHRR